MDSFDDIWNNYRRWCRLVILLCQGGKSVCNDILSKMGIKDTTDGSEIYDRLKPYEKEIHQMGLYHQQYLLPDNEVIDTSKMDVQLSSYIIQILDKAEEYPSISALRQKKNELFLMSEDERAMTEKKFRPYWNEISELLTCLDCNMDFIRGLETEGRLSQDHEKILKDITQKTKGNIQFFSPVLLFFKF